VWVMIFSILVQGGQWVQIQDSPVRRDYLHMRFESREERASRFGAGREAHGSWGNRAVQMRAA
jgi:hypothetical protein